MKFNQILNCCSIACLCLLTACGGGGGGSSSAPAPGPAPTPASAVDDSFTILEDTPTVFNVTANDSNVDSASITIAEQPDNGAVQVLATGIRYTPNTDFSGSDQFSYQVAGSGNVTLQAQVSITVTAVTETLVQTEVLTIPATGYASQNNAELATNVLTSPDIEFSIEPNTISFSLSLIGGDVGQGTTELFIAELTPPNASSITPLQRQVTFCDINYCSGLVPRRPDQAAIVGSWSVRLGTLAGSLNRIDLSSIELRVTTRTGPAVSQSATLTVQPFLSATSISNAELSPVLDQLSTMAAASNIVLDVNPVQTITDPRFTEVSRSFTDPTTGELLRLGGANQVNLFFIEDFSGAGGAGLLGISGGLPGPFGQTSQFNGVLVNATANLGSSTTAYARTTAEIAFHEIGHFLGLYHTTERDFAIYDVIDDTNQCSNANDRVGVGVQGTADIEECADGQNLMFWTSDLTGNKVPLTPDQQQVIFRSPIARP